MILLPHIIVFPFLYLSFTFFPLQFFFSGFFYFLAVLIPNACVCFHFLFSSLIFYSFLHFFFHPDGVALNCTWHASETNTKQSLVNVLRLLCFLISLFSSLSLLFSQHLSFLFPLTALIPKLCQFKLQSKRFLSSLFFLSFLSSQPFILLFLFLIVLIVIGSPDAAPNIQGKRILSNY